MTDRYESPEVSIILSEEEIHKRYQDTAMVIFKELQSKNEVNYLSFGDSRRTMEYSNNGNEPVIIRRPAASVARQNTYLSSQLLKARWKLYDNLMKRTRSN